MEGFKEIPGFSNYMVCSDGMIWSKFYRKERIAYAGATGYKRVSLVADNKQSKTKMVSRLVAEAWLEKSPRAMVMKMVVHYIDGDLSNCNVANLKWVSASDSIHMGRNRVNESSKFCNVRHMTPKSWAARISVKSKQMHIGCFRSEEEAARAVDAYTAMLYGQNVKRNLAAA